MKLVIEIPKGALEVLNTKGVDWLGAEHILSAVAHGVPLDTVKAKIETDLSWSMFDEYGNETRLHKDLMEILANIGKEDMRGKSCNTCKNDGDEFSGECYECVKNIQNHYEPEEVNNDNT